MECCESFAEKVQKRFGTKKNASIFEFRIEIGKKPTTCTHECTHARTTRTHVFKKTHPSLSWKSTTLFSPVILSCTEQESENLSPLACTGQQRYNLLVKCSLFS